MTSDATRRSFLSLAAAAGLAPALSGCVMDGLATGTVAETQSALDVSPVLLVATTRKPVGGNPPRSPFFGSDRGRGLSFAEARMSAPDRSLIGKVSAVVSGDWGCARSAR